MKSAVGNYCLVILADYGILHHSYAEITMFVFYQ